MSTRNSMRRIACAICIIVTTLIVVQTYSLYLYLPGALTPTISTDKDVYHVGEEIRANYSLVNNNVWVIMSPTPVSYDGMVGQYEGEYNPYGVAINSTPASATVVVGVGAEYFMDRQSFTANKVGKFIITTSTVSKTVEVIP